MGELHLQISRRFRLGGFAPGDYVAKCMTCGEMFGGDKRAVTCLPCAADEADTARSEAQPPGYDRGKSLGERLYEAVSGAFGLWPWSEVKEREGPQWEIAALTFTASLSDASPEPAEGQK